MGSGLSVVSRIIPKAASASPSINTCIPRYGMSHRLSRRVSPNSDLKIVVDRIDHPDLLVQKATVDLGVPRLVHRLGRRVELRVHVGHRLHDPRRADHRALLTVQKLAELPGGVVLPQLALLPLAHLRPVRRPVQGHRLLRRTERVVRVDLQVPVDPQLPVPLLVLALLVQGEKPLAAVVVLPAKTGRAGRRHPPLRVSAGPWRTGRMSACPAGSHAVDEASTSRARGIDGLADKQSHKSSDDVPR